jgi:hypothetical protein
MMALFRKPFTDRATYPMTHLDSTSYLTMGDPVSFSGSCGMPNLRVAAERLKIFAIYHQLFSNINYVVLSRSFQT